MNKLLYTLFVFLILYLPINAQTVKPTTQQVEQRATITRIADLITSQPALNEQKLNEAMKKIDRFKESDITYLLKQLVSPGKGNNSKIEYATNSYSFYVMQAGKETQRAKFVQGLIGALKDIKDKDNKGYVISLLQQSGKDDAVAALTSYLKDENLCGKAARALATIGTEVASKALLSELPGANGRARVSIIEALGDTRYAGAEAVLLPFLGKENADVQKVLLYALSNIGGLSSSDALKNAAQKMGYAYDVSNATAAYIHYTKRLVENGEVENQKYKKCI